MIKTLLWVFLIFSEVICREIISLHTQQAGQLQLIAEKIKDGIQSSIFDLHTKDTNMNMDCLKINYQLTDLPFGVFHSSQNLEHYSWLYYSQMKNLNDTNSWSSTVRLSERGSQGNILMVDQGGILIGYQLENHQHGNTIAIRYYQNQLQLKSNNFLYEYQLSQIISSKNARNIGTPTLQRLILIKNETEYKYNQYYLEIKFHYSPDGAHDYPGFGHVYLRPLRDFVDHTGKWIGGCFQKYTQWQGVADNQVLGAIRQAGCPGKIGQRDYFYINSAIYYLYQCNINSDFDWKSWRIFIYSPQLKQAKNLGLQLSEDIDIANPHISLKQKNGNLFQFVMTFFLPSEGTPGTSARPGSSVSITKFSYP